jgi:DNA repair photolyase
MRQSGGINSMFPAEKSSNDYRPRPAPLFRPMIQVIAAERKSAVLTPSSLACLARVPTVNLTAGCAHECRYCYARGYRTYPGEGRVRFYENTLTRLQAELQRKRKKPAAVYFSPSSDPFQPIPEVLDMTFEVFKLLLNSGIGVAFLTKGVIPQRHRRLLAAHAPLVRGRIGVVTLDPKIATAFEPHAPPPEARVAQAAELAAEKITVEARIDPILPGLSDGEEPLESLCAALAKAGVRMAAASVLFLRPAVIGALRRHISDAAMLRTLLDAFANKEPLVIRTGDSRVLALPTEARRNILDRLRAVARRHGLEIRICACKNPDTPAGSCNISGRWPPTASISRQLGLFRG